MTPGHSETARHGGDARSHHSETARHRGDARSQRDGPSQRRRQVTEATPGHRDDARSQRRRQVTARRPVTEVTQGHSETARHRGDARSQRRHQVTARRPDAQRPVTEVVSGHSRMGGWGGRSRQVVTSCLTLHSTTVNLRRRHTEQICRTQLANGQTKLNICHPYRLRNSRGHDDGGNASAIGAPVSLGMNRHEATYCPLGATWVHWVHLIRVHEVQRRNFVCAAKCTHRLHSECSCRNTADISRQRRRTVPARPARTFRSGEASCRLQRAPPIVNTQWRCHQPRVYAAVWLGIASKRGSRRQRASHVRRTISRIRGAFSARRCSR